MQKLILVSVILITALAGIQSCTGQCYALPSPDTNEEYLFAQSVCGGVDSGPLKPTVFTADETRTMTKIGTYHYNNGNGATPGTIGLKDQNGKIWGPWQAKGQGSVPTYWVVSLRPALELPAGTYTVLDSDSSTWSYGSESEGRGIVSTIALKPVSEPLGNYGTEGGSNADGSQNPNLPNGIGTWILKEVQPDILPQPDRADGSYYDYHISYEKNSVTGGYSWKDSSCHGEVWATSSWTEFPKVLVPGEKQETTLTADAGGSQTCGYRNIGAGTWLRINDGNVGPDADYAYATSDPKPAPVSAEDSWIVPPGKLGDTLTISIRVNHQAAQASHHSISYIYSYQAGDQAEASARSSQGSHMTEASSDSTGGQSSTNGGIQLAGSWMMLGHQTGFNDWEADLALNSDGTLSWTETKGANVGATRRGTWQFDGTNFTMSWVSPSGGLTKWTTWSVTEDNLGDGTYTVENAPGGTWSATRSN